MGIREAEVRLTRLPAPLAAAALASGIGLEPLASPKPGNTHRFREKPDARLRDFVTSGIAAAPILHALMSRGETSIGAYIYGVAVYTVRLHGGGNTSLGTAMLLAPLASSLAASGMVFRGVPQLCRDASMRVRNTGVRDALYFYKALRELRPSYIDPEYRRLPSILDESYEEKLREREVTLRRVLEEAEAWDPVSRNMLHDYYEALEVYTMLREKWGSRDWEKHVVDAYLTLLSARPDGLVYVKHGLEEALRVMRMAYKAMMLGGPWNRRGARYLRFMDTMLGKSGVNPGSTADIVAVGVSLVLLDRLAGLVDSGRLAENM